MYIFGTHLTRVHTFFIFTALTVLLKWEDTSESLLLPLVVSRRNIRIIIAGKKISGLRMQLCSSWKKPIRSDCRDHALQPLRHARQSAPSSLYWPQAGSQVRKKAKGAEEIFILVWIRSLNQVSAGKMRASPSGREGRIPTTLISTVQTGYQLDCKRYCKSLPFSCTPHFNGMEIKFKHYNVLSLQKDSQDKSQVQSVVLYTYNFLIFRQSFNWLIPIIMKR